MAPSISPPGRPAASLWQAKADRKSRKLKAQKAAITKVTKHTRGANIAPDYFAIEKDNSPKVSPPGRPAAALRDKKKNKRHPHEASARVSKSNLTRKQRRVEQAPPSPGASRGHSPTALPAKAIDLTGIIPSGQKQQVCDYHVPDFASKQSTSHVFVVAGAEVDELVVSAIGKPGPRKRKPVPAQTPPPQLPSVFTLMPSPDLTPHTPAWGISAQERGGAFTNFVMTHTGSKTQDAVLPLEQDKVKARKARLVDAQEGAVRIGTDMFEDPQLEAKSIADKTGDDVSRQDAPAKSPQGDAAKGAARDTSSSNPSIPVVAAVATTTHNSWSAQHELEHKPRFVKPPIGSLSHPIMICTPPANAKVAPSVAPNPPRKRAPAPAEQDVRKPQGDITALPPTKANPSSLGADTATNATAIRRPASRTQQQSSREARINRAQASSHFASPEKKTDGNKYNFKPREARRCTVKKRHHDSPVGCDGPGCQFKHSGPSRLLNLIRCRNCSKLYHKKCVGRENTAKYPNNSDWTCRLCRISNASKKCPPKEDTAQRMLRLSQAGWELPSQKIAR